MNPFIGSILSAIQLKEGLAVWVLAVAMAANTYQLSTVADNLTKESHASTTQYAINVLKYGYSDVSSPEEVIALTKKWNKEKWGAQIAAIRTLCNEKPNRLFELVDQETAVTLCRMSR